MDRNAFDQAYSDEWWFQRLFLAFDERKKRRDGHKRSRTWWMNYLWDWYIGDPPLPEYQEGWQSQVAREVLQMGRANYALLAVESKMDRLKLQAFRTLDEEDDDEEDGPEELARRCMKRYKSEFATAILHASVMTEGYLVVDDPQPSAKLPVLTAEDPRQFVGITDPLDDHKVIAALKVYSNELDGYDYAHVILAGDPEAADELQRKDRVRKAKRRRSAAGGFRFSKSAWEWDGEATPTITQGRGTMVHKIPALRELGDFEPFLDLLKRINSTIVDRIWITKLQVFRQRALEDSANPDEADPMPETDESGEPIDYEQLFAADPGTLWRLPQGFKIWESTPTDITPVLVSVRDDVKEFAGLTRTPLYVFLPDAVQGSAEGASLAREGMVFKAEAWQEHLDRPFLAAAADLMAAGGQADAAEGELELVWMPAERFSMSQKGDAAVKAKEAGVPWEGRMQEYLQASPETVKRWKRQRSTDLLFIDPTQPTPAPAPEPAPRPPEPAPDVPVG